MNRLLLQATAVLFLLILSSCDTIREKREACPSIVTLDLSNTDPLIDYLTIWFFGQDGALLEKDTVLKENYRNLYNVKMKRELVECHVWGNPDTDSLYYCRKDIDATGETAMAEIVVCREHADIFLLLDGYTEGGAVSSSIACTTKGRMVNGDYVEKENIIEGVAGKGPEGKLLFRHRMIRQKDISAMKLTITSFSPDGLRHEHVYNLGEWLRSLDYDMNARNLEDVVIEADFSFSYFNITVEPWNFGEKFEVTV